MGFREKGSQPTIASVCWILNENSFEIKETGTERAFISVGCRQLEIDLALSEVLDHFARSSVKIRPPEAHPDLREAMNSFREFMDAWWNDLEPRRRVGR